MIGAFDSGMGGINVLGYLRKLMPLADVIFLRDGKNCPYGSKSREALTEITEINIKALRELGADTVLIACCTASTVFPFVREEYKRGVIPIADAVAQRASEMSESKEIAVIATEATVRHRFFSERMTNCRVREIPLQPLVEMVEEGVCDDNCSERNERRLKALLPIEKMEGCDCLVLGCTHFSSLKRALGGIVAPLGIRKICDSALVGAQTLMNEKKEITGGASTYYITT